MSDVWAVTGAVDNESLYTGFLLGVSGDTGNEGGLPVEMDDSLEVSVQPWGSCAMSIVDMLGLVIGRGT